MKDLGSPLPLGRDDFSELLEFLDSNFRNYMHSREVLSTLSASVLRKYNRHLPKRPKLTREEKDLQHRMIAALHLYEINAICASRGGGHFASGLLATAACEAIMIVRLIEEKAQVRRLKTFAKHWQKFNKGATRDQASKTYAHFLLEQRAEILFRLAKEAGLFHEENLPEPVAAILRMRGFEGRLCEFVRQYRNCIHPRWMIRANDQHARTGEVSYSVEGMDSFIADFALCAWELHGRLGQPQALLAS